MVMPPLTQTALKMLRRFTERGRVYGIHRNVVDREDEDLIAWLMRARLLRKDADGWIWLTRFGREAIKC